MTAAAAGPRKPTAPLEEEIQRLEQMRDLFKATGNSRRREEMDATIAARRKLLTEVAKGPRAFPAAELEAIRASLTPARTDIAAGVPVDLQPSLKTFQSLVNQGVQMTDAQMHDLEPADAYVRLVSVAWHAPDEQVMFKTFQGGNIVMSTLRPEYLPSLAYYTEKTRDGIVFFEQKKDQFERIESPHQFVSAYKDKPERALTHAIDGSYLPLEDARKREIEWSKKLIAINQGAGAPEAPRVVDLGDSVSIGGIVIHKRPR